MVNQSDSDGNGCRHCRSRDNAHQRTDTVQDAQDKQVKNVCTECNRKVKEDLVGVSEPCWQGWLCEGCFDKYLNNELTDGFEFTDG